MACVRNLNLQRTAGSASSSGLSATRLHRPTLHVLRCTSSASAPGSAPGQRDASDNTQQAPADDKAKASTEQQVKPKKGLWASPPNLPHLEKPGVKPFIDKDVKTNVDM